MPPHQSILPIIPIAGASESKDKIPAPAMKPPGLSLILLLLLLLLLLPFDVSAQESDGGYGTSVQTALRPSVAVVIGVLSIMFSLTCLLLVYAKFCHNGSAELLGGGVGAMGDLNHPLGILRSGRFSGIDKTVIESLPLFRFSSLKGTKEGLECSVCLSKFEDNEILRLLPKCKHAFHIGCVDKWLESHSSCPLCRYKVELNDLDMFSYSRSLRREWSDLREDPTVELFVQRETDRDGSSRFSIGSSFRKLADKSKKEEEDGELLLQEGSEDPQLLHKFKHRILVSDVVLKNRWSDVNYSDLMFLNSDMLNVTSSQRFASLDAESKRLSGDGDEFRTNGRVMSIREEMEKKRALERKVSVKNGRVCAVSVVGLDPSTSTSEANGGGESKQLMVPAGKRSMSEITSVSRSFVDLSDRGRMKESSPPSVGGGGEEEEKVRRAWLAIARRTVMWLAGREIRSQPSQQQQAQATRASNV
ncbi:hypothetical protein ACLOJK_021160 [Asimina triloba]